MRTWIACALLFSAPVAAAIDLQTRPLLVPIVNREIAGRGATWKTSIWVHNGNQDAVTGEAYILPWHLPEDCPNPCSGPLPLPGGATMEATTWYSDNPAPAGLIVDVESDRYDRVRVAARLFETSDPNDFHGVTLPVVRDTEFFRGRVTLLDAPALPSSRLTLRVYALQTREEALTIRLHDMVTGAQLGTLLATLEPAAAGGPQRIPAFTEIGNLETLIPAVSGKRLRIDIETTDPERPLWAMASVTNNVTQQITIIAPE